MNRLDPPHRLRRTWLALLLVAGTVAVYGQMVWNHHKFIMYDDHLYVTENAEVQRGLTTDGVLRAFKLSSNVAANWHPITMITHMADTQLFGYQDEGAWGHHLNNLILHALDTVLLFLVMARITGRDWPSFLVAALFAWHPIHVESVAWVSERKDVLSAFFWFLAMGVYASFTQRRGWLRYTWLCLLLILGLLSKPMVVTLPCVLMLLDYWPLGRLNDQSLLSREFWGGVWRITVEKIPLFLIVVAASYITFHAQRSSHAVAPLEKFPIQTRLVNSIASYNAYITNMLFPVGLCIPYEIIARPMTRPQAFLGTIGLTLVTSIALIMRQRFPYVLVGWLWYVGTMVPVIGLVQVGSQYMADRYSYIPLIGLFIVFAFGLADLVEHVRWTRIPVIAGTTALVGLLLVLCYWQVGYWKDTITLFSHTVRQSSHNHTAQFALGTGYYSQRDFERALAQFNKAILIAPTEHMAHFNKALALVQLDRYEEAQKHYEKSLQYGHEPIETRSQMARNLIRLHRWDDAERECQWVLSQNDKSAEVHFALGTVYLRQDRTADALAIFRKSAELKPAFMLPRISLARILATHPDPQFRDGAEAVKLAKPICEKLEWRNATAIDTLAAAYAEAGDFDQARAAGAKARQRALHDGEEELAQQIARRYELYLVNRPYREDPKEFEPDTK